MKNLFSFLALLLVAGLSLAGNSPKKLDGSPALDPRSTAHAAAARRETPRDAATPPRSDGNGGFSSLVPEISQQVAAIADVRAIHVPAKVEAPPVFTEPAKVSPKPVVKAAPAGHYELRRQCGPGGCSTVRVWVPAPAGKPVPPAAVSQPAMQGRSFQPVRRLAGRLLGRRR